MALDIVGIFDPTPTADLVNAGISAWRGDGWGAFLSVISAVPYVGDLAKLGKLGKWAETVAKAVDTVANNPAMRKVLEPALRKISDLIGALPAKAFDALPDSAKAALLSIKGKIDDVLGKAGAEAGNTAAESPNATSRSKLVAGTAEHKAQRWADYQTRGGTWTPERWSKQYDINMRNVTLGLQREAAYREILGGISTSKKTPFTLRQIDIYRTDEAYIGQLKTGKVSLTKQAIIDIKKDSHFVDLGFKVEYILEKGASKTFLKALDNAGIHYKIGSQL